MTSPHGSAPRPDSPKRTLRVATVQMESKPWDKDANFAKVETFLDQAAKQGVKMAVFPECCITGYWFIRNLSPKDLDRLSEPVFEGPSSRRLIALSKKYGMTLGAGWIEKGDAGAYHNTYVVAMPNGETRRHRKIHSFEHDLVKSGSEFTVFDTPHGFRVGILICYDNNLNENVRITAMMGAEIVLAPHQTGGCRSTNPHIMGLVERHLWDHRHKDPSAIEREFAGEKGRAWLMRWLPSRAHDNGVFLVFSNGVGVDDDEVRTGNAMIIDPHGRILAETGKADDAMVVADLDGSLPPRSLGRRFIATRRPELYGLLARRTGVERDTREVRFESW